MKDNESVFNMKNKKIKKKKYSKKWTIKRSRLLFLLKRLNKWLFGKKGNILMSQGVHFITAPSGAGKTLLSNWILRSMCLGKDAFMWVNIDQYDNNITQHFLVDGLFKDGQQIAKLSKKWGNKKSKGVIFDEINLFFNRRENKKKEYNEIFIPLMKFSVTHRHQDQDRIYFLGQNKNLQDTQIQSILKYQHRVFASKKWYYYYFREKQEMIYAPKYLKVITFNNVGQDNSGNTEWKQTSKQKIKITIELLESYDTHGFAEFVKDLPIYKK